MNREPLLSTAGLTAAVSAVLALLVAFGLDLTGDQQTAILGVVAVAAPVVVALVGRRKVTPVEPAPARRADTGAVDLRDALTLALIVLVVVVILVVVGAL